MGRAARLTEYAINPPLMTDGTVGEVRPNDTDYPVLTGHTGNGASGEAAATTQGPGTRGLPASVASALSWARPLLESKIPLKYVAMVVLVPFLPRLVGGFLPDGIPAQSGQDKGLGVEEMVRAVRKDLEAAEDTMTARNEAALFNVKHFDLEISFVAHETRRGSGKFEYHVLTLDTERQISTERIQKLQLHFEAAPPLNDSTKASSTPPDSGTSMQIVGPLPPPGHGKR